MHDYFIFYESVMFICKHFYHKKCIIRWIRTGNNTVCPVCKENLKLSNDNIGGWYNKSQKKIKFNLKKKEVQFFKNLKKIGYRYFDIFKRCNSDKKIIKSFQQHYLPNHITGKIDLKTLKISHLLANKF